MLCGSIQQDAAVPAAAAVLLHIIACAGTTSEALTKERPWLQAHLSTIASAIAILVGVLIGLAGLGWDVPFFS
jgi:hypothetical protein